MATDVAMDDMQIDFEEPDPEIARLQAEADAINAQANETTEDSAMNASEPIEDGEVDTSAPAPTKVHVRGLNQLNTFDIEAWVKEHEQGDLFQRVQWVDDSSANLLFDNEIAAAEALNALAAEEAMDPLQMRAAKRLSTHPDADLQVRQAMLSDVKAPRAKERSAFYLFNKDWDPDNPDNIRPDRKRKRYDTAYRSNKLRRREPQELVSFSEDMYDDDPASLARRHSHSTDGDGGQRARARLGDELMDGRRGGRLRDRSASPVGDADGRYGFSDDQVRRRTARARSFTPPGARVARDNRAARDSLRKELFPERGGQANSSALADGHSNGNRLNPSATTPEPSTPSQARELFPDRLSTPSHRRQDAQDLHPDEIARAIGQYSIDGSADHPTTSPHSYQPQTMTHHHHTYNIINRAGRRPDERNERNTTSSSGRDLFSRVTGGPPKLASSRHGRLDENSATDRDGFSIKGAGAAAAAATATADTGFSILGASRERAQNPLVKELFPIKAGHGNDEGARAGDAGRGGRDLFDGRIKGRGAQRRKAEDLF